MQFVLSFAISAAFMWLSLALPANAESIELPMDGRPVSVQVPSSYDPDRPAPLLILLHGYTGSGRGHERYLRFGPVAEEQGLLFVAPDGTRDCRGDRHWDATEACCHFCGPEVDDSVYLRNLISEVAKRWSVDSLRVFIVGHSNGGFMAFRMACEHADLVAAIASLAGATYADPGACRPKTPVHVLQIHGEHDGVVPFHGGELYGSAFPGAERTVAIWAEYNRCESKLESVDEKFDLLRRVPGKETEIRRYRGCAQGGSSELWSMGAGAHVPQFTPNFTKRVVEHLLEHPKPAASD